jgi:hypothetical protein
MLLQGDAKTRLPQFADARQNSSNHYLKDDRKEAVRAGVLNLRDQIHAGFNVVKAQADAVLFEFGPSRERKLENSVTTSGGGGNRILGRTVGGAKRLVSTIFWRVCFENCPPRLQKHEWHSRKTWLIIVKNKCRTTSLGRKGYQCPLTPIYSGICRRRRLAARNSELLLESRLADSSAPSPI